MDEKLIEIFRRARISDYLRSRGMELMQTRRGFKCACPLPRHQDDTPSFYVTTMPDGGEVFRCFGCGKHGSVLTLINEIEGTPKGTIVRRLSELHGIKGGGFARVESFDPTNESVLAAFCQEDQRAHDIAERCLHFVESQGGSEDAVNKVEKVYQVMDRMIEEGDSMGLVGLEKRLKSIIMLSNGFAGDE